MMSIFSTRLAAMIVKELWAVLRDPRGRIILFVPPLLQIILFSAAATLEVKNVDIGVLNRDTGTASREFVNQLAGSPNVRRIIALQSSAQLKEAINRQQVIGALVFDERFSRDVAARRPATVQAIYDGRRSNASQILSGYIGQIAASTSIALNTSAAPSTSGVVVTNWFNPNLDYLWFIMPALVVQIGAISALSVSSQSIARERELGSFDQLMVSPLRTWEILLGKLVPPFAAGIINGTLYLIVIPLIFGVPFTGSVLLFYLALIAGLYSVVGIGLLVSAISKTQQQAFLGQFAVTPPLILLSGFASPVDNMPRWLQWLSDANPLKHFNIAMEGLFLKAMPVDILLRTISPLFIIGTVTLAIAVHAFRARTE